MPLYDQLDLTLELLQTDGTTYLDEDPSGPLRDGVPVLVPLARPLARVAHISGPGGLQSSFS